MKYCFPIILLNVVTEGAFNGYPGSNKSLLTTSTTLLGRKKGNLSNIVDTEGGSNRRKNKGNNMQSIRESSESKISPSLSQWAATIDNDTVTSKTSTDQPVNVTPIETPQSTIISRRQRAVLRESLDGQRTQQIDATISKLNCLIESKNLSVDEILQQIKLLIKVQSTITLKGLLKKGMNNYRLAWVGSDEAICHLGTGLHKVPLARLQDIFFSLGRDISGQAKTVTLLEVIRIIGPFPNVRNTLQGEIVEQRSRERNIGGGFIIENNITILYDRMMDGLGKEINAGTEDNVRSLDLNILFANERALVCLVPDGFIHENLEKQLGENGKNILLFLKEENLDLKLEKLRVV